MNLDEIESYRSREIQDKAEIARLRAALLARASGTADHIISEIQGTDGGDDPFFAAVRATRMPMVVADPRLDDIPIC